MSTGGTFIIQTNDGKQDDMMMAPRFLNSRLDKIQRLRAQDPTVDDPTPSLVDIEKTHHIFMNAHFKPFVSMAYEYQVVNTTQVQLGGNVQFSLPLYGDYIHDITVHLTLDAVSSTNTGSGNRLLRYCDYPGERILKTVQFTVNGNDLDKYESETYPFYREFQLKPGKKSGYDRMMGQQTKIEATRNTSTGRGSGVQEKISVVNGHQTPKASQQALDLWVPLLFWFCLDSRLSLISVAIPYGQRFINLQLANANELLQHLGVAAQDDSPGTNPVPVPNVSKCELYVNNIFCTPEIHAIIVKRIGFNLIRVFRYQKIVKNVPSDRILMSSFKWPIETIYCGARPLANFDVTSTKMLDSWHMFGVNTAVTAQSGAADTNQLLLGALANNPAQAADYTAAFTRMDGQTTGLDFAVALGVPGATVLSVTQINTVLSRAGYTPLSGTFANPAAPLNIEVRAALPRGSVLSYNTCAPNIDTLEVEAHGVQLYKAYPVKLYNSYLPFHFGDTDIQTPSDCGKFMIPFNLYPGTYQPSGHVNVSRAREFYLNYVSTTISQNSQAELFFIGIAINFLLISDGAAVLRYST
jgi:hypothetical protein